MRHIAVYDSQTFCWGTLCDYLNQANWLFQHHLQLTNLNEMYSKINIFLGLILLSVLLAVSVQSAAVDLVVEKLPETVAPTTQPIDANSVPQQCHQPKETGRCFALFYRFAYNLDKRACEQFIYGGCAGNSNNFETLEQCEQICLGKLAPTSATDISLNLTTDQPVADVTTEKSTV